MKIQTARFGELETEESKVIQFVRGPLGFEDKTRWIIVENGLLGWLQSIDDSELAFVVANPFEFYGDYQVDIADEEMNILNVRANSDLAVLSIVSVPPNVENMTINLLAPIVINCKKNTAQQVILNNNQYSVRHYLYTDLMKCAQNKEQLASA